MISVRFLLLLILLAAATGEAQVSATVDRLSAGAPVAESRFSTAIRDSADTSNTGRNTPGTRFLTRAGVGLVGGTLGFIVGAYAGIGVAGPCNGCGDDLHGLGEAALGAVIGAIVGTGTAAAIPKFASSCSYAKRAGVGLAGSLIGGAAAIGVLFLPQPANWTAPLFPPLGAALMLKAC